MKYDLKLVKLPKTKEISEDFYGVGYYAENGEFIFSVITPKFIENSPLRSVHPKEWNTQVYEDEINVIGNIVNLPGTK